MKLKKTRHIIRQGDVLLVEVKDKPKEGRKVKGLVLAYGEVTGHAHRLDGEVELLSGQNDEQLERFASVGGPSLKIVARNDTPLHHEEHSPLILKKGKVYEIRRQREYDASLEARERPVYD